MGVCRECGTTLRIRRGLCRSCQRRMGKGDIPMAEQKPPRAPELEPPHDRPWVHRGGG